MKNMNENEAKQHAKKIYDERIKSNLNAIDAAGQWGESEFVPLICQEILKKIKITKSDRILEIGCGSGVLGSYLRDKCAEYHGIDISHKMFKKFQEEYDIEKEISLTQSVSDSLPFPDNTFSKVLMNSVTMYLQKDNQFKKTLMEIERACEDNGIIFIGDNIIPSRIYWEYSWFQNLNNTLQFFVKFYIKFRLLVASKYPKFSGKWTFAYNTVSPNYMKKYFHKKGKVTISDSATMTIKKKGEKWKGNRRMDFLIELNVNG